MHVLPNIEALDDFLSLTKEGMPKAKQPAAPKAPELKSLQKKEMDLWHTWNKTGRKAKDLKPLFESYKPLIQRTASKFVNRVEMPASAIQAELRKQFVNAVKTYDPGKGAQLNSWVSTHLQKTSRFIKTYQNLGKIPEGNIAKITEFNRARDELTDKLGHEPDAHSLADHLKWTPKRVIQLQKEMSRKDKPLSSFKDDPADIFTPKELEAIHLLQYDSRLGAQERSVYEYVFGMNGKPRLGPGQIAKKMNLHQSKVSRIRTKLKGFLNEAIEVL